MRRAHSRLGRFFTAALPYGWLLAFFLAPFLIVFKISLSETRQGIPPYLPLWRDDGLHLNWANYGFLLSDPLYFHALVSSLQVAAVSTLACLLIGYPMAYGMARAPRSLRTPLLMLVVLPFWTSLLLRVYAWIGLLRNEGLINQMLIGLGLTDEPLPLLYTPFAVHLGIVYSYLPFMILPLYATLERLDAGLLEAAADLGCRPFRAFRSITLPLSWPGIVAGSLLVFIPAVGEFVIPDLLGGPDSLMIGNVLWSEFFSNRDWPVASAVAVVLLVLLVAPIAVLQRAQRGDAP